MKLFHLLVFPLILSGCYLSKSLEEPVRVKIDPSIIIIRTNNGNSNFIDQFEDADFAAIFLTELEKELVRSEVVIDNVNPQFIVEEMQLSIMESSEEETVKDSTSEEDGFIYELTSLNYNATGNLLRLRDGSNTSWSASKSKSEKLKSSRNVVQIVAGQNKEQNEYREKDFSTSDATRLAGVCGDHSGVVIVKKIIKMTP